MTPLYLKFGGFRGLYAGGEREYDFSKLDPSANLVAIAGPNGAGKTTFLSLLTPYNVMPGRSSAASPSSFSYYDQVYVGDSYKVLDWVHHGVRYRSDIRIRVTESGKTKKTEAYLFVMLGDTAVPYRDEATGLQSDGKTSTYDACVEKVLGPAETFLTAMFSAQGKRSLSDMKASDVKALFAQMLNLDQLQELSKKAAEVLKELRPHLTQAQAQAAELLTKVSDLESLQERKEKLSLGLAEFVRLRDALRRERDEAQLVLARLTGEQERQRETAQRHEQIKQRIQSARQQREEEMRSLGQAQAVERQAAEKRLAEAQSSQLAARRALSQALEQLSSSEKLAARKPGIEQAAQNLKGLMQQGESLRVEHESLQAPVQKLREVEATLSKLKEALARMESDGQHMAAAIELAKKTASLMGDVPCAGTEMSSRCKLLAQARQAQEGLPQQEQKIQFFRKEYRGILQQGKSHERSLPELQEAAKRLEAVVVQRQQNVQAIAHCEAQLSHREAVEQAVQALPGLRESVSLSEAEVKRVAAAVNDAQKELAGLTQRHQAQRQERDARLLQAIHALEDEQKALPALVGDADVHAARKAVALLDDRQKRNDESIASHEASVAEIRVKLNAAKDIKREFDAQQRLVDGISSEMEKWKLLSHALGGKGIVAMSIDDMGPSIADKANRLLLQCYGGRFQISLNTQQNLEGGLKRETFEIAVSDNHRGESKLLEQMSGGEKVWINECLIRGIALYLSESSGMQYQTLFSDEVDGALDSERKRQFMAMKRAVLELGHYEREFMITQTPELIDMCDAVIDVTKL